MDYYNIGTVACELLTAEAPFSVLKDRKTLYNDILTKTVEIPTTFSRNLQDFLKRLLDKNPKTRLGSRGIDEIALHPWLTDAPQTPQLQPSHLLIQKLVKEIDLEADKGILIDSKNWFGQNPKKSTTTKVMVLHEQHQRNRRV